MKITDEQILKWQYPPFKYERKLAKETARAINKALSEKRELGYHEFEVYPKGSYANKTNVRHNSDIDVAVVLKDFATTSFENGMSFDGLRLEKYQGGFTKELFKNYVYSALIEEFGISNVDARGNKVFKLNYYKSSGDKITADVIPATMHYHYKTPQKIEGIKLILNTKDDKDSTGTRNVNYPKQHRTNGRIKNEETNRKYKKVIRILKNANNLLGDIGGTKFPSYMIECLAFNINTNYYIENYISRGMIKTILENMYTYVNSPEPIEERRRWLEVNGVKSLFSVDQKWSRDDARNFIISIYSML